jgi:hypothetical protein
VQILVGRNREPPMHSLRRCLCSNSGFLVMTRAARPQLLARRAQYSAPHRPGSAYFPAPVISIQATRELAGVNALGRPAPEMPGEDIEYDDETRSFSRTTCDCAIERNSG